MARRPSSLVFAVVAAALVAGGAGFVAGTRAPSASVPVVEHDDTPGPEPAPAPRSDEAPASAPPSPSGPARRDAPLPPADAPLAQIHDALVRRAAGGDARAACRLAAEHERCERSRVQLQAVDTRAAQQADWQARRPDLDDAARTRAERQRARTADRRAALQQVLAHCAAAPPLSPDARARYWRQAALAGHVPSLRHYASGSAFRLDDLMGALPALQTYRREAETLAVRAAEAGDVPSQYALALAYAGIEDGRRRSFLAQSITPDLPRALAWFSVLARDPAIIALPPRHPAARTIARHHAGLQAAATPSEAAEAARLAARVTAGDGSARDAFALVPNGAVRDIPVEACAEGGFADG